MALIIVGHPKIKTSIANKTIIEEIQKKKSKMGNKKSRRIIPKL